MYQYVNILWQQYKSIKAAIGVKISAHNKKCAQSHFKGPLAHFSFRCTSILPRLYLNFVYL